MSLTNTFQTVSPVDNSIYYKGVLADGNKIEETLATAQKTNEAWKNTTISERTIICQKVVEYFLNNADEVGEELSWQMGRPIRYTPFEITKGFKERAEYMIGIAESSLKDIEVTQMEGFKRYIKREPLGTVFILAPWNYPYLTSVNAIIPAIMAGNTVILKHSDQTPRCAERYAAAFEYANAPKGVFQYLHLNHTQVADVIQDNRISFVAFTGSVKGGYAVQQAASQRFINTGMELGGKDPAYVCKDANFESAVENLVDGAFFNSGQSCCGIERIYVDKAAYNSFVDAFVSLTKQYQLGNPLLSETTLGPMVRTTAANFARHQIEHAIQKGAKSLVETKHFPAHDIESPYMAPQVLVNVNHEMGLMTEESFAPVVGIMPVQNEDEAVRLMNDSQYGLTASIWTSDVEKAIRIGDKIDTGTFFMNRCDYLDPALAWTGVKNSGKGCTLSTIGYEMLTRPKSFHLRLV